MDGGRPTVVGDPQADVDADGLAEGLREARRIGAYREHHSPGAKWQLWRSQIVA